VIGTLLPDCAIKPPAAEADEDGVSDLQHSSNLSPSYSVHTWLSVKTTLPGGRVV